MYDATIITSPNIDFLGNNFHLFPRPILAATLLKENSVESCYADFNCLGRYGRKLKEIKSQNLLEENNKLWFIIKKKINDIKPYLVFIECKYEREYPLILLLIEKIKEILPDSKIIIFGERIPTLYPEYFLKNKYIDIVIKGEFENTIKEISDAYIKGIKNLEDINGISYRKGEHIITTKIRELEEDLNKFPIPDRNLAFGKKYYKRVAFGIIEGSRGCIYNCKFCTTQRNLTFFRYRDPEIILEELIKVMKEFKTREFYFWTTSFAHNKEWAKKLCELIIEKKINIIWTSYINAIEVNQEIIELMKKAGVYLTYIGFESGNPDILKSMGKPQNLEIMFRAAEIIKRNKIFLNGSFMMGYPGETNQSLKDTISVAIKIKPDKYNFALFEPEMGTTAHEELMREGNLLVKDINDYSNNGIFFESESINNIELKNKWKKLYNNITIPSMNSLRKKILLNPKYLLCKVQERISHKINIGN